MEDITMVDYTKTYQNQMKFYFFHRIFHDDIPLLSPQMIQSGLFISSSMNCRINLESASRAAY